MTQDEIFMSEAIRLSQAALDKGNEPFGAVLVKDGEIVMTNENQIYSREDPMWHAEAGLLRRFCEETHITDLREYTLYSSTEPCYMCAGCMVWMRLGRLVYGADTYDTTRLQGIEGYDIVEEVFGKSMWSPEVTPWVLRDKAVEVLEKYPWRG